MSQNLVLDLKFRRNGQNMWSVDKILVLEQENLTLFEEDTAIIFDIT